MSESNETKMTEEEVVEQEVDDQELYDVIASSEKVMHYTKEKYGFEASIKYKLPNMKQRNTASMVYSKMFNKLLQDDDHMTTSQLLTSGKKRGLWSDEDEVRLSVIDSEILAKKELVETEKNKKKKGKLEGDLVSLRDEKFRLAIKIGNLTGTSIEVLSEQERTSYMLCNCIYAMDTESNFNLLYPTREELDNEQDLKMLEAVLLEAKSFWTGEGLSDFLHLGD